MATTKTPKAKETADRPVPLQQDVDLDPTGGTMHVRSSGASGAGDFGVIRDDVGKLEEPYGLYYFDPDTEAWEALAAAEYKVGNNRVELIQSAARVGESWHPVVHVYLNGKLLTATCDHKAGCVRTGMPAEMIGPVSGGTVKYDLARGGTFFGQYKIKLDNLPPSP